MPRMSRVLLLAAVLVCSFAAILPDAKAAEPQVFVITAAGTTDQGLSREAVAQIFTRRLKIWKSDVRIQPVNLPVAHPLRRSFSMAVLGRLPEDMEDYWREQYFQGVLPPHVLASEEAVILFVASTPGAIGYVSTCDPGNRVTVVFAIGKTAQCPR